MASDASSSVQPDFEIFSRLIMKQFMGTERPWLNLYGKRVRPIAPFGSVSSRPFIDPALIHRSLPDELLFEVFARADPYSLGRAACVCRKWRYTIRNPNLWQNACLKAWQLSGMMETFKVFKSIYDCSWRKMWIQRPRVRFDGLYVSRNTYLRVGVPEWTVTNPVHLVCYYRYIRFYPNGKLLYKVSSQRVKEAVRCMHIRASKADCVYKGEFKLSEDQIDAAILYPGFRLTLLRIHARVRGTAQGANNRLDLLRLVTTGVNESEIKNHEGGMLGFVEGWPEDETHDPDVPAVSHSRGLSPCVFVPFNEADTSVLNLPVDKMDYFVPG